MSLSIVQLLGDNPPSKPFRLVETYDTIDGPRSRLTHKCFATYEEAVHWVKQFSRGEP